MDRHEVGFWVAVAIVGVAGVVILKVLSKQSWAPSGLKRLGEVA